MNENNYFAANFLRINIYLTQKVSEDMIYNITVNDAGADYDPLTLLRSRTMFGRPDWATIYAKMRQAIESGQYLPGAKSQLKTKVQVSVGWYFLSFSHYPHLQTYFCGPGPLAKVIKDATYENTNAEVEFTFAKVNKQSSLRG